MPKKLHLLSISSWYPEDANSRNGIFILQQMEAMAEREDVQVGILAAVARPHHTTTLLQKRQKGVQHCIGGYPQGDYPAWQGLRYFRAVMKAWQQYIKSEGKPDLIMVQVVWKAGWMALWLHYRYNIPFVVMEHWSGYLPEAAGFRGFWRKYLTKLIVERAERVCTVSETLQTAMQHWVLQNRYSIVPNVVDTDVFTPNHRPKAEHPVFLHVSNLAKVKRFELLLASFAAFRAAHPTAQFHVAGAFTPEQALMDYQGPWEGVVLHGVLEQAALADLYRAAHALLLASRYETFSIVVPEALACGCGVISADLPAIRGHAALGGIHFVPHDTVHDWYTAMKAYWQDMAALQYDAHAAVAEKFSKQAVAETLYKVLTKCVDAP